MQLIVHLYKEILLLSKDLHGLALLFVMPTLFILIMSLAMQDTFSRHSSVKLDYMLINEDGAEPSLWFEEQLESSAHFQRQVSAASHDEMREQLQKDDAAFLVVVPADFSTSLGSVPIKLSTVTVRVAPGTQAPTILLFETKLRELTGRLFIDTATRSLGAGAGGFDLAALESSVVVLSSGNDSVLLPTSVQQNVPAWLVFSMFFIAIPVSTALLTERNNGTLARLNSMGVSKPTILVSKMFAYMLINLLQVILMFAVGVWVVPQLGGESLALGNSSFGLLVMAVATSFSAVSFALVIANLASTTEQATVMAGASNIILAAIGGIMIPRFVMPEAMQNFSVMSPHAWGLEGFLDIILRGGGVRDILIESGLLCLFGLLMLLISVFLLNRR